MNAEQQALWQRIESFAIDASPTVPLPFVARLARENGWSRSYAERVIREYKRFVMLCQTADHMVVPSEQVDQAWHLHLTYTVSYWDRFCGDTLGRKLHHHPTEGGADEQAKFVALYDRTRASYEALFGEAPPEDIWSPAEVRFGDDLQTVRVNTCWHWIVPKLRLRTNWRNLWSRAALAPLFLLGFSGVALGNVASDPLDWTGPEFLTLYAGMMLGAAMLAMLARLLLRPQGDVRLLEDRGPLDAYEAATLAHGPERAIHAALASLMHGKHLQLTDATASYALLFLRREKVFRQGEPLPKGAPPLEKHLFELAAEPKSLTRLVTAARPEVARIENRLVEQGLLTSSHGLSLERWVAGGLMASPLLLGVAKIMVGIQRERPVGFLIALCVATTVLAFCFLLCGSKRTSLGSKLLAKMLENHKDRAEAGRLGPENLQPADLAMTVGLFGVTLLAVGPLQELYATMPRHITGPQNSSGGCSGGCSSGCSGGCGGGCGGGGCGGCGG